MSDSSAVEHSTGVSPELHPGTKAQLADEHPPRDVRFWLIFVSLCVCGFIAALELVWSLLLKVLTVNELSGVHFNGSSHYCGRTPWRAIHLGRIGVRPCCHRTDASERRTGTSAEIIHS
jgi:hypothetical protein